MKLSNLFDPHSTRPNTHPALAVLTSCGTPSQPYNEQISLQLTEARSQLGTQSKSYRALRAISHVLESQKLFENDPEISDTSIWLYTEGCQSALHILLDNQTAKITWLGSLNGTGRQLLEQGLAQSQKQGASLAVVKPIWNSHKFYEQMGFQDQGTGYWGKTLVESAEGLDRSELEDLLGAIEYEQEEIDNASYDAAGSKYEKLDKDFKALEAVAYVVKNNLRALDDPKLGKNSIFLYNYTPDLGVFSVTAIHVVIENQVAHVKWLGSYDNKPGAGKALMLQALTVAKSKGATKSVVEAKWESEGFYHKLGYDVEHRGSDNPFTGTSLVQMGKKLEEGWTDEDQRMVHKNPTIQDLKRLARNNKYHSARFVIYNDGSVVAADSEHYTHHSAAPAIGAWAVRGYVQYLGGNDYAYRSMEVYSPKSVDHPIFRVWERAGIEDGNQSNQISEAVSPKRLQYRATWTGRLGEYDPNFFDVEEDKYTDDDGKVILVKDKLTPSPNLQANLDITPNPQLVYRGMSNAEFEVIKKTGKIQSRGDYNMGGQEGLTYFSTDPQSAEVYANSFAPWSHKANWENPAWVIAVPKPDPSRVRKVAGTGEHEVGIEGTIPASEIREVYRGRVVEYDPGVPERVAPSAWLHWEKMPLSNLSSLDEKELDEIEIIPQQDFGQDHILQVLHLATQQSDTILGLEIYVYDENQTRLVAAWDDKNKQLASAAIFQHQPQLRQRLYVGKNVETYPGYRNQKLAGRLYKYCKETLGMTIQSDMSQTISSKTLWTKTLPSLGLHPKILDLQTSKTFDAGPIDPYQNNNLRYCWILESNDKYPNKLSENSLVQPYSNIYVGQEQLWEITQQVTQINLVDRLYQPVNETWTKKYKKSINCNSPKGFSQRAHCAARKKRQAGGQTRSKSVSESRMDQLVESMLAQLARQGLTEAAAVAHIDHQLSENLRKWFQQKWVRFGPDGKIRGACARGSEGEGKPKCLPQKKAWALGKKKRATAAARKRRQDPNPEREGKAKNVATKESVGSTKLGDLCTIKTNFPDADFWLVRRSDRKNVGKPTKEFSPYHVGIKVTATEQLMPQYLYYMMMHLYNQGYWNSRSMGMSNLVHIRTEDVKNIQLALTEHALKENSSCPHCGGQMVNYSMLSEKQDACYYKVKSRYKVWPSAYASGALVQCRKKGAKNWGKGKK